MRKIHILHNNNQEIHLKNLQKCLSKSHVTINLSFLNKLLINASKSNTPHMDKKFTNKLDMIFNKKVQRSTTIYGWMKGYRTVPFNKLRKIIQLSDHSFDSVQKHVKLIKAGIRRGEVKITFPIKIGEDLGAIVGYILGDGSIDMKYKQVFFSNSNIELIKDFIQKMEIIFGIKPRIWVQKRKNFEEKTEWEYRIENINEYLGEGNIGLFYPKICGIILHSICGKFANGKKKCITLQILQQNRDFHRYMIKAFFDSEGSAYNYRYMIRIFQDNKQMLDQIRSMLDNFSIKSNKTRYYIKRNKKRYCFDITNKENFNRFHKEIGFLSSKKRLHPC